MDDNAQTIELLQQIIAPGDVVLVKGSRALHLEEVVMALARPAWNTDHDT
jgi:UDP-N-acetylmuramyl pentapeptide synthase